MYTYQNHDMRLFYSSYDDVINAHILRYFWKKYLDDLGGVPGGSKYG